MEQLTDQEKSVLLARAMGWKLKTSLNHRRDTEVIILNEQLARVDKAKPYMLYNGDDSAVWHKLMLNLYDPSNMALAWRVMNWAYEQSKGSHFNRVWMMERFEFDIEYLGTEPAADAICLILDKILSLAIEDGIVEVDDAD